MSKVLVFLAQGFEEIEGLTVVDLGRRAGLDVKTVSITGEKVVTGARGIPVVADVLFENADIDSADMLVLPGGMPGTKNLEAYEPLMAKVDAFAAANKYIAAICAAPTVFGHRGLLNGKNACCYPGMEGDLVGAKANENTVNIDGKIITSRGLGTAIDFSLAIISELIDQATADKIGASVVYGK